MFKKFKDMVKNDFEFVCVCILFNIIYIIKLFFLKQIEESNVLVIYASNILFYFIVFKYFWSYLKRYKDFKFNEIINFVVWNILLYYCLIICNGIYMIGITFLSPNLLIFGILFIIGLIIFLFFCIFIPLFAMNCLYDYNKRGRN